MCVRKETRGIPRVQSNPKEQVPVCALVPGHRATACCRPRFWPSLARALRAHVGPRLTGSPPELRTPTRRKKKEKHWRIDTSGDVASRCGTKTAWNDGTRGKRRGEIFDVILLLDHSQTSTSLRYYASQLQRACPDSYRFRHRTIATARTRTELEGMRL